MSQRGPERRSNIERRSGTDRRVADRRQPERAGPGRRVLFPFDRRVAERRFTERRTAWPDSAESQAY